MPFYYYQAAQYMKVWIILYIAIRSNLLFAQTDTISLRINTDTYQKAGKNRLISLQIKEQNIASNSILNKFTIEELNILSIPIFDLSKQAKAYKCGDNMEFLINFREDSLFQRVFLVKNQKQVGMFDILDSYNKENYIRDSLEKDNPFHLHHNPLIIDALSVHKHIVDYKYKNPDVIIFMIKDIHGYWAIKNNKLIKLEAGLGNKIKEIEASYIFNIYGEEYIHDISNNALRAGYPYRKCLKKHNYKQITIINYL